jgi:hypothetical protein
MFSRMIESKILLNLTAWQPILQPAPIMTKDLTKVGLPFLRNQKNHMNQDGAIMLRDQ